MTQFNPYNVIVLLSVAFSAFNLPQSPITSEEVEVKEKIERILHDIQNEKEFQLEEQETLDFYDEFEVPEAEKVDLIDPDGEKVYLPEEVVCSSVEETISSEEFTPLLQYSTAAFHYRKAAVEYWRSGVNKPRSLEGVRQKFKKVTSIRQLRRWEDQANQGGNRYEKLKQSLNTH